MMIVVTVTTKSMKIYIWQVMTLEERPFVYTEAITGEEECVGEGRVPCPRLNSTTAGGPLAGTSLADLGLKTQFIIIMAIKPTLEEIYTTTM